MKRSWDLAEAARPVRAAREYVAETAGEWGLAHYRDDATLVVSEMVTNACRYGLPPITLTISCAADSPPRPSELVIEVSDGLPTPPTRRMPSGNGGLGMVVIERLSALTVITHDAGKTVRAVLTTTDQPELE
jgi:anti-sigma regulatory factor (Ser/Thr protein kinase)